MRCCSSSNAQEGEPERILPCLSGEKYKKCGLGKVDWEDVYRQNLDQRSYLSVRGRNVMFANGVDDILGLYTRGEIQNLRDYKSAITAKAVREIYELAMNDQIVPKACPSGRSIRRAGVLGSLVV